MHRTIDFPNLGIHLKSVGDHITVFGFDSAYYGIVIGIGILAGLMMAVMEAKRTHQNVEDYNNLAIYGVIFSIIGARAYYVIFSWDMYKDDIKSIINIREGGLAIYGGVITAIVVVFIFAKIKGLSPFLLFDTGGFGLITGQMKTECYFLNIRDRFMNGNTVISMRYIQISELQRIFFWHRHTATAILIHLTIWNRNKTFWKRITVYC